MRNSAGARFQTIDGLRGIAAMAVVIFHLNGAARLTYGDWLPPALDWLFEQGLLGVDVFFVISGFVIAYSVRNADLTTGFIGRFALRRSIRLDPPYWFAIFLEIGVQFVALRLALSEAALPSIGQFVAHFFYLQNLLGLGDIVDIFWTLCFEIQFYLALIVFLVLGARIEARLGSRFRFGLASVALAGLFAYSVSVRYGVFGLGTHPGFALVRWYQFFMGICVWWVVSGRAPWQALVGTWAGLAGVVAWHGESLQQLVPIAVSGLVWWSYRRDRMATLLSGRVLQFLGAISYSLYILHTTVGWRAIRLSGRLLEPTAHPAAISLVFAATVGLCVFTAWIAWRLIEVPSTRLSHRVALPRRLEAG